MRCLRSTLLLVALLGACDVPTGPALPVGAVQLVPPAPYAMWWQLTEQCSGLEASFTSVRWYVVPGAAEIVVDGRSYQGYWWPNGNRIVLAEHAALNGPLVRHEMLHAITGRGDHSRNQYMSRCGGIVSCSGECETEVGPRPEPGVDAPELQPADLQVAVRVVPTDLAWSADSGWFTVTVTATNPLAEAVWVRLDGHEPGYPVAPTFGYIISSRDDPEGADGGYEWTDESRWAFGAGETRRLMFDFSFPAGDYDVRGFFNNDTTTVTALSIRP